jgi:hypothetical protein
MSSAEANQGWNACVSKFVVNSGVGLVVGATASLLFFKRRVPPILYFTGLGGGLALVDCNKQFKALKALTEKNSHTASTFATKAKEPVEKYNIAPPLGPSATELQPVPEPVIVHSEEAPGQSETGESSS